MNSPKYEASIEQYFKDIEDSSGLSQQVEKELSQRIRSGDEGALSTLIEANLRFVVSVARQFQNKGLPLSDLIGAGNLGLIIAATRFDGERGFKFISYAVWWIRQSIMQSLKDQSSLVRLPFNQINEIGRVNGAIRDLEQLLHRRPSLVEIAAELGIERKQVERLLQIMQTPVSLETPDVNDTPDYRLEKLIQEDPTVDLEEELVQKELKRELSNALRSLTNMENSVVCMYYGLDRIKAMTLEEIGEHFGKSRERIRQIKERALCRLKHPARSEVLREFALLGE